MRFTCPWVVYMRYVVKIKCVCVYVCMHVHVCVQCMSDCVCVCRRRLINMKVMKVKRTRLSYQVSTSEAVLSERIASLLILIIKDVLPKRQHLCSSGRMIVVVMQVCVCVCVCVLFSICIYQVNNVVFWEMILTCQTMMSNVQI